MLHTNLDYLRRILNATPAALLHEPQFLKAQTLFFSVVEGMGGEVDFDIADMREVHAVAALGDVSGLRVLDIGCGSTEPYVLGDSFRDRYPPFFAEMMTRLGAKVTGLDTRPNPTAQYDHRIVDCTKPDWIRGLESPYDVIAILSLFNAPESPFENDPKLCDLLLEHARDLLSADGCLIATLRDDAFGAHGRSEDRIRTDMSSKGLFLTHLDGNCAWLSRSGGSPHAATRSSAPFRTGSSGPRARRLRPDG